MKKAIFIMLTGIFLAVSVTSCREKNEEPVLSEQEQLIQDMRNDGADVKVKQVGDQTKIKMETDDKKVKIKEDGDGNSKIKVTDKTDDN
ncbi:MAG: hypothetical protein H0X63_02765 [Flavobacteriales bacterium]|jgi:hypothetical protein|nr:hypothetical protein [Flavobacteriales bacterium]